MRVLKLAYWCAVYLWRREQYLYTVRYVASRKRAMRVLHEEDDYPAAWARLVTEAYADAP